MRKLLLALSLGFALAGCAQLDKATQFVMTVTQAVVSPLSDINIYRVKNVYDIAGKAAVRWREACWARSYKSLIADPVWKPICQNRRETLRVMQSADNEAAKLIDAAERSGGAAVTAAWNAVLAFQGKVPVTP